MVVGGEAPSVLNEKALDGLQADNLPFGKILKVLGYLRKIRYHLIIELSF